MRWLLLALAAAAALLGALAASAQTASLAMVEQVGGPVYAAAVQGQYVYAGSGPRLVVLDASDPERPREVGRSERLDGNVRDVVLDGRYAYVAAGTYADVGGYLALFDLADPLRPALVATYGPVDSQAPAVAVAGGYAYLATGTGLRVVDVRDPARPTHVALLGVGANDVAVVGRYAYVAEARPRSEPSDPTGGLTVLDLADPASPTIVARESRENVAALAVAAGHAYLSDGSIYDVSTPSQPSLVNSYPRVSGLVFDGNRLYAREALEPYRFLVFDVVVPGQPRLVGSSPLPSSAANFTRGLAAAGGRAYVPYGQGGLRVMDVSSPAGPREVGAYRPVTTGFVANGRYGVAVDGVALQVLDLANPLRPTVVGALDLPVPHTASGVVVEGSRAYVSTWDGLLVVDAADPGRPAMLGTLSLPGRDIFRTAGAVAGGFVYMVDWTAFRVIDARDPARPVEVGALGTAEARAVTVAGRLAYVTTYDPDLLIVDVADPASPRRVGSYDTGAIGFGVAVRDGAAYLTLSDGKLHVVDVADPARPALIGLVGLRPGTMGITLDGPRGYAGGAPGLDVFDLSDPRAPRLEGTVRLTGGANGASVSCGYVYASNSADRGLWVLRPEGAGAPLPPATGRRLILPVLPERSSPAAAC